MASLTISNPSLRTGDTINFSFSGFNGAGSVWVGVVGGGGAWFNVGSNGSGGGAFQIGEGSGSYTLEAYDDMGMYYASASFTVIGGTYNPTLSCTSSLQSGQTLSFNFAGFPAYASVWVGVVGGGGMYVSANGSGAGSGSFTDGDPAGSYTLEAVSGTNRATANFTVTAGQSAGWKPMLTMFITSSTLLAQTFAPSLTTSSTVVQGGTLIFSFAGFPPNVQVLVGISGEHGGQYITSTSSGTGAGSQQIVGEGPGDYILQATYTTYSATAPFTVTAAQSAGWHPMLTGLISSGTLNYSAPQSEGWKPMLSILVTSGVLNFVPPQSQGWKPMLFSLVTSGRLDYTAPQSGGWHPMLASLVDAQLATTGGVSGGWHSMLTTLVTSGTLKVPGGEEPPSNNWLVPALVIGGAIVIGAAASNKDKIKSTYNKIPKEIGYKPKVKA